MIKFGRVTAYDPATGMADISYVRPDACAKCGACSSLNKTGTICLRVDAEPGNWVRVVLPDSKFLSAAGLAFALPLVGFLGGLAAGYFLFGKQDLWAVIGGLAGVGVCMGLLKAVEHKIRSSSDWVPYVDRVYTEAPASDELGCEGPGA